TTRPDTVYGVTFMAIAPDAKLMRKLLPRCPNREAVEEYVRKALLKPEIERTSGEREKDGVDSGLHVRNPFNGEEVPLYVADYVLAGYGSGAVMAVPAHDQRDFEFARKYGIPVKPVIRPADGPPLDGETMTEAYVADGIMHDSGPFDGVPNREGIKKVAAYAREKGFGKETVTYKLRDWLLSRQRYWGAPIPVVHCPSCGVVPVPEKDLPVLLPEVEDFLPRGRSPLEDVESFMNTSCPKCGGEARRDPDTMDTFVCSSWYQFRYVDPRNDQAPWDKKKIRDWMPVDLYIGGNEHATGHLIYFRFITKVLHDAGWVPVKEPVKKLFHHGMVYDEKGEVMSKSKGNVVSPVVLIDEWGVDVPRTAMLFFAPPDREILWSDKGMVGAKRFLNRVAALVDRVVEAGGKFSGPDCPLYPWAEAPENEKPLLRKLHQTVKKVTHDMEAIQFNTAIAAMMELVNQVGDGPEDPGSPMAVHLAGTLVKLLAPAAPHLAEELWEKLGGEYSVFQREWPGFEEAACLEDT
ncbi:MAG TPA: leucine--tRNA ligase, partial [Planctomycetes bacterium]|nr:leucine--tRNA ligase [Planctomycetota bacterium]